MKDHVSAIAKSIRSLAIDGVEKANSGHPGAPMGLADFVAVLFANHLTFDPSHPSWEGRDRFVLSAGHASMLLYSILHLAGYKYTLDDLKNFRQLNSHTPGHPEYHLDYGVETTTGPLGQGIANAVGMALSGKLMKARFGEAWDKKVYCIAGDGCFMEGVGQEAISFAGHYNLDNLILIYDYNSITLDGPREQSCSEDVKKRFESENYQVFDIDGHNLNEIDDLLTKLKKAQSRPTLIMLRTIIGWGSPKKQGTADVHGAPLGAEELKGAKEFHGICLDQPFWIDPKATEFFQKRKKELEKERLAWNGGKGIDFLKEGIPSDLEKALEGIQWKEKMAGRDASHEVIQTIAKLKKNFFSLSADLSHSNKSLIKEGGVVTRSDYSGRNIHAGVREFAMAGIENGMSLYGLQASAATFFCFSDYMRPAMRLAALGGVPSIFLFTHDSIGLGEDGPTHQPIEHLASLRAMPNMLVFRPSDPYEVAMSWLYALSSKNRPSSLVFSRQGYARIMGCVKPLKEGVAKGAYIVDGQEENPDFVLIASGSEVRLCVDVAEALKKEGKTVNVVSMVCWDLFEEQDSSYQATILRGKKRVAVEMGSSFGWHKFSNFQICIDTFGISAPDKEAFKHFGFTVEQIKEKLTSF